MSKIYNHSGGYRKLHSFNFATIIHLGTMSFCKRYLSWKDDPLGKTLGQMVGASRSGKQNIVEGSERAKTSTETEIKLTDVAKASLGELQGDLEDYLVHKGEIPWSIHNPDHQAILTIMLDEYEYTEDLLHDYWKYLLAQKKKFDPWLEARDDITAASRKKCTKPGSKHEPTQLLPNARSVAPPCASTPPRGETSGVAPPTLVARASEASRETIE